MTVEISELPEQALRSVNKTVYVMPTDVVNFICVLGSWGTEILDGFDDSQCHKFALGVSNIALSLVLDICNIVAGRTTENIG